MKPLSLDSLVQSLGSRASIKERTRIDIATAIWGLGARKSAAEMVWEYIQNAYDATRGRKDARCKVVLREEKEGGRPVYVLEVYDNGVGMYYDATIPEVELDADKQEHKHNILRINRKLGVESWKAAEKGMSGKHATGGSTAWTSKTNRETGMVLWYSRHAGKPSCALSFTNSKEGLESPRVLLAGLPQREETGTTVVIKDLTERAVTEMRDHFTDFHKKLMQSCRQYVLDGLQIEFDILGRKIDRLQLFKYGRNPVLDETLHDDSFGDIRVELYLEKVPKVQGVMIESRGSIAVRQVNRAYPDIFNGDWGFGCLTGSIYVPDLPTTQNRDQEGCIDETVEGVILMLKRISAAITPKLGRSIETFKRRQDTQARTQMLTRVVETTFEHMPPEVRSYFEANFVYADDKQEGEVEDPEEPGATFGGARPGKKRKNRRPRDRKESVKVGVPRRDRAVQPIVSQAEVPYIVFEQPIEGLDSMYDFQIEERADGKKRLHIYINQLHPLYHTADRDPDQSVIEQYIARMTMGALTEVLHADHDPRAILNAYIKWDLKVSEQLGKK